MYLGRSTHGSSFRPPWRNPSLLQLLAHSDLQQVELKGVKQFVPKEGEDENVKKEMDERWSDEKAADVKAGVVSDNES